MYGIFVAFNANKLRTEVFQGETLVKALEKYADFIQQKLFDDYAAFDVEIEGSEDNGGWIKITNSSFNKPQVIEYKYEEIGSHFRGVSNTLDEWTNFDFPVRHEIRKF